MKRLLLIFCCWICYFSLSGQQINYAEYFIDQDPGFGKATSFSIIPGSYAEVTHIIPINGIDNGLHLLYTRVRNVSGTWSQTKHFAFFVQNLPVDINSDILEVEYFFNKDPGVGKAIPISFEENKDVTITATLPLSGIPEGINTLFFRTKDKLGNWSQTLNFTILFQKLPFNISANIHEIEYFFDEDPGPGKGSKIPFEISDNITVAGDLPLDNFSEGIHTLYLRAKDSNGSWGMVSDFNFLVQKLPAGLQSQITRMEYFFDQDPGYGKGKPIHLEANNKLIIATEIPLETLTDGIHTIYVRSMDNRGCWGTVFHSNFLKVEKLSEKKEIIALEYFLNEDPGFGKGIPIKLNTPRETTLKYFVLDGAQFQPGKNVLYIRALDKNRAWGHIFSTEFEVLETGACSPPIDLTASEVTENEANLGWSQEGDANAWDILWVKKGEDFTEDGTLGTKSTANLFPASQLAPSTLYNFYVRSWCPDGQVSNWANPGVFHTLPLTVNEVILLADPPFGGTCSGSGSYSWGENISVTANPNPNFIFRYWSGDTVYLDNPNAPSSNIVMPEVPVTLTAHFLDVTGMEEHPEKSLRIYPVPATDELWVEYYNPNNEKVIFQFMNLQGKILAQEILEGTGLHKIRLEVLKMPSGFYLLKIEGPTLNTVRKISIRR